jgi:hypothetical protein
MLRLPRHWLSTPDVDRLYVPIVAFAKDDTTEIAMLLTRAHIDIAV